MRRVRSTRVGLCLLLLLSFLFAPSVSAEAATSKRKPTARRHATIKKSSAKRYSARSARARRLKLAKARAAAAARAYREAATPKFKVDDQGELVPDLRAAAGIIYNPVTGEVLWEENSQNKRSIASITKVMTAVVFLEDDPDLKQDVMVERRDVSAASTTFLRANERVRAQDLLHLMLVASDNAAARALARISPWGSKGFVQRMNEKAIELGLVNTTFADPSGLDPANLSSAYDLSRLITYAAGDERIGPIMRTKEYAFATNRRVVSVHSTNRLLDISGVDVRGGKTGFIHQAGYCLATMLKLPHGDQVAVVVLGARSNAGRFLETRHLFNWLATKAQSLFSARPLQPQPQN
ncbi:MAG: D-alanyl-D-alanine carboxypeptidase [Acidobacteria bacterium]|nr:D-alanyl-D-alanine carboxypeptidase [Acidobacteriota bacterium]